MSRSVRDKLPEPRILGYESRINTTTGLQRYPVKGYTEEDVKAILEQQYPGSSECILCTNCLCKKK